MEKTEEKVKTLCFACKNRYGSREEEPCKSCIERARKRQEEARQNVRYRSTVEVQQNVCISCPQVICDPEKEPCKSCISAFSQRKHA